MNRRAPELSASSSGSATGWAASSKLSPGDGRRSNAKEKNPMLLEQNGRWFEADSVGQDRKAELLSVDAERNAEYTGLQFLVPDDGHGKLLDISHYATKDLAEQVAS